MPETSPSPERKKPVRKILTKAKQQALYVNTAAGRSVILRCLEAAMVSHVPVLSEDDIREMTVLIERLKARA